MVPQTIDLTGLLAPYKGQWVALSSDEKHVVGSGTSLEIVLRQAKGAGVEKPLVLRVPDENTAYLL